MIIEVDDTQFPIIIFKTLPVEVSDNDLEEYLSFFEKLLREVPEKVIIIHDVNKSRFLSGDQITRIKNWGIAQRALFAEKTLDTAVVTSSVLSTLIVKTIRLLIKSDFQSEMFTNLDSALRWAKKRLAENKK